MYSGQNGSGLWFKRGVNSGPKRECRPRLAGAYLPRLVDHHVADLFAQLPALLITGPRATGKTTTARQHAAAMIRLDRPAEAAAFQADPDAALRGQPEPLLLDEWQSVPSVLGAVKRAIDDDPRPGRFLLTGSVRAAAISISRFAAASRSRSSGCPDRVDKRGWMDISTSY